MYKGHLHYLVTGAAGFIGSHLVRSLLHDDTVYVTGIDNFDPFYKRQIKLQNLADLEASHNFFLLDIDLDTATPKRLHEVVPQPVDVIIHLAAKAGVRPSITDPIGFYQTNIIATQRLLDFAVQKRVRKFVFASSSSVYGTNDHLPWREDEQLQPISPYAMSKLAGEGAGHVYCQLYGLSFIALRLFTVYGPGQRPDLAIHRFTKAIVQGTPVTLFGDGSTSRDYTYVDDIVAGIRAAINYGDTPFEIINLGNHQAVPLKDLITALECVTGKKAILDQRPAQPGDVLHTYADISKARRLLGYEPRTELEQGLHCFYEWFTRHSGLLLQP